jgi:LPS export ABC transporter protein LptC
MLLLLIYAPVLADGERKRSKDAQPAERQAVTPPLTMQGLHLEEFQEGGKGVDLWAGSAQYTREEGEILLQDVRIRKEPAQKGARGFDLTGSQGTYDLNTRVAVIRGDVRLLTDDGYVLYTETVRYDYDARKMEGPGAVRMEGPEGLTEGVGLRMDLDEETVVLGENVRSVIEPSALQRAKEAFH